MSYSRNDEDFATRMEMIRHERLYIYLVLVDSICNSDSKNYQNFRVVQ